jgi:hypothetical protein
MPVVTQSPRCPGQCVAKTGQLISGWHFGAHLLGHQVITHLLDSLKHLALFGCGYGQDNGRLQHGELPLLEVML